MDCHFLEIQLCAHSYYFSAVADRIGGLEELCGRLMLAVWQDESTPSNFLLSFEGKEYALL